MTGFGKTLRMGFFQKIEFDAWLINSTIELSRVQVLGRSYAWLWRYSALFAIAPHPISLDKPLCVKNANLTVVGTVREELSPELEL